MSYGCRVDWMLVYLILAQVALISLKLDDIIKNWFFALIPCLVGLTVISLLAVIYDWWRERWRFEKDKFSWGRFLEEYSTEMIPFSFVATTWTSFCGKINISFLLFFLLEIMKLMMKFWLGLIGRVMTYFGIIQIVAFLVLFCVKEEMIEWIPMYCVFVPLAILLLMIFMTTLCFIKQLKLIAALLILSVLLFSTFLSLLYLYIEYQVIDFNVLDSNSFIFFRNLTY